MTNLLGGENEIIEDEIIDDSDDEGSPPNYELLVVPEGYVMDEETARDFLACNDISDLKKLLAKLKEKSPTARMKLLMLLHLCLLLIRIMISQLILS